jgi:hypothetical protein
MVAPILIPFIIIAVLAVIAILIFSIPLDISVSIERGEESAGVIFFAGWSIWGLKFLYSEGRGTVELLVSGKAFYKKTILPGPSKVPEVLRGTWDIRSAISMIQGISALLPGILRMLRALKHHTRVHHLSGNLVLGTGSPAETGLIFGIFSAIRPILMVSDRVSLTLEPVFDRKVLEGTFRLGLRVDKPLIMIVLGFRLFVSSEGLATMKRARLHDGETGV